MTAKLYSSYKDSGSIWLNKVPAHWKVAPLKRLLNIQNGADQKAVESEEGFPIYGSGGIFGYANQYLYDGKSVLLGRKGTIDKPLFVDGKFWTVDTMYWSKILPTADPKFSYYLATRIPFDFYSTSTALPSMTKGDLGSHIVAYPEVEEQQRIANYLDRETAKIDELIQKQEDLIQLYGERINALVLEGLKNSSAKYIRLMHASENVFRPVSQEEDASYRPLGLYNRGRGIFIKEERDTDDMGDSNFFWVKSGDLIFSGQFAWEGSVAMAQVEHEDCVVSHRYPVIRGKEGIALTEYLLALFQTSHGDFLLNENSRGAAGRNKPLNISLLLKEKIPIINMESQLKIKILIDSKERFLKKSAQEIALLKEHRASLISAAVTGKIDVRELV